MLRKIRAKYLLGASATHFAQFNRMITDLKAGNEAIVDHALKNEAKIAELQAENAELEAQHLKNVTLCDNIEKLVS